MDFSFDIFNTFDTIESVEGTRLQSREVINDHGASILNKIISLPENEFKSRYRMSQSTFFLLVHKVNF